MKNSIIYLEEYKRNLTNMAFVTDTRKYFRKNLDFGCKSLCFIV